MQPGQLFTPTNQLLHVRDNAVQVEVQTLGNGKTLYKELKKLHLYGAGASGKAVWGWLPINQLGELVTIPALASARAVQAALATGSVTSQGDTSLRADVARSLYGVTGSGIKVGILSDSFNTSGNGSYATDVSTGDLPAGVQILEDYAGGTDEGRAMAQLVYDTAPGVSIAFATAFNSETDFANKIKALRDAGCKIIIDDVMYFDEPMFQDGILAQAVDNVVASGVAYFSAAGNQARQAYDTSWRADRTLSAGTITKGGSQGINFLGGTTLNYDSSGGTDDLQAFSLKGLQTLTLSVQWDQPYGSIPGSASSAVELDVYVLDSAGTLIVGGSATTNTGSGADPVELIQFTNTSSYPTSYNLMIVKRSSADPGEIKYVNFGTSTPFTEYNTNSGTLFGHANAAGAAAVAAAAWYNTPAYGVSPPLVESFSSVGYTPILFGASGTRLASPTVRQRPNFTAPDGGNTTFFYSDSSSDPDTYPNFFGTSAAAPAAGAVAAPMLSANPSLTPSQIYSVLQNTAIDMNDPGTVGFDTGFDRATGYGLIQADAAVQSVLQPGAISGIAFRDYNADGVAGAGEPPLSGIAVFLDTNNNGILDPSETSTITLADGSYSFSVQPGSYYVRQVAPSDTIATDVGPYSVSVSSGATVRGPNFGNFPVVYTGSASADVYAVGLDPNNSSRIQISETLGTNPTAIYSIDQARISALTFNTGAGSDSMTLNGALPVGVIFNGGTDNDTLNINGGAHAFSNDFQAGTADLNLNVLAGSVEFDSIQHLGNLSIADGASAVMATNGNWYLKTTGLSLAGSATLDLNDNDLLVQYTASSPFTQIQQWVTTGYTAPGNPGIISTLIAKHRRSHDPGTARQRGLRCRRVAHGLGKHHCSPYHHREVYLLRRHEPRRAGDRRRLRRDRREPGANRREPGAGLEPWRHQLRLQHHGRRLQRNRRESWPRLRQPPVVAQPLR